MTYATASETTLGRARRILVWAVIVSFTLAAIMGILVLLGVGAGSNFGSELTAKVLSTTALVGLTSLLVLCAALILDGTARWFALVTIIIAVGATVTLLLQIWASLDIDWKWTITLLFTPTALAVLCLVLRLGRGAGPALRITVRLTLVAIALATLGTLYMIWFVGAEEWTARLVGILGILAALGVIVSIVLTLVGRAARPAVVAPAPNAPDWAQRLIEEANARGITVEELVAPLLADPAPTARVAADGTRSDR
ncbi:hypothetical protein [Microbacterium gorillae]|uniref:hypothetical protein n=1 Tax=Microbacterium gorillae TaxID=1231063 RepID=UPI00058E5B27|nr:hypothetical protein [Microbacterium gorillae]